MPAGWTGRPKSVMVLLLGLVLVSSGRGLRKKHSCARWGFAPRLVMAGQSEGRVPGMTAEGVEMNETADP